MKKCADYYIVKIRYYADKHLLDKHHKNGGKGAYPAQHQERAEAYFDFFWEFFEKFTGHKKSKYYFDYMFETRVCAQEELFEKFGVYIPEGEGSYKWFIPIEQTEMIQYVKDNCKNPMKVLKITNMNYFKLNSMPSDYWRKESIKFSEEMKIKFPMLKEI